MPDLILHLIHYLIKVPRIYVLIKSQIFTTLQSMYLSLLNVFLFQVTRDGKFTQLKSDKSNYSTMMYVRVQIVAWAMHVLMPATVVAVRYSAVRRQASLKPG